MKSPMEAVENSQTEFPTAPTGPQSLADKEQTRTDQW
jgi:hypothetical protein